MPAPEDGRARQCGPFGRLSRFRLPAKFRLASRAPDSLHQPAFAMAQLLGEAVRHDIDGLVEIVPVIFRVNIRSRQGEMDFDHKGVLERALIVVPKRHMRADQVQSKMLQTFDFLGHVPVDGRCQFDITGADMNLHTSTLTAPQKDVHGGKMRACGNSWPFRIDCDTV